MENENTSGSAAPESTSSAETKAVQENPRGSEQQSTEWRDRILREKKELKKRLQDAEQKIEAFTGERLQKDGKLEEYNRHLEQQLKEEREKRLDDRAKFAHRTLSERLRAEAQALGCVDLETAMKVADVDKISIGDDLEIDQTSVKLLMEDLRKSKPFLFKGQSIPVKDGVPASSLDPAKQAVNAPKKKSPMEMSDEEFKAAFRNGIASSPS